MAKWNYTGDINLREGGLYWREDGADDYVLAVRVTPCSDGGGPSNLFYIEDGSVYIGTDTKVIARALDTIGATPETASRRDIVEAMVAYWGLDGPTQTVIRIGKEETDRPNGWNPSPDVILRGNASLERYVRREFLL